MRCADRSALMSLAELFPRTKQMLSTMFDFPLPFGPRTQLKPFWKTSYVLFAKDLKPFALILLRVLILVFDGWCFINVFDVFCKGL